MTNVMKSWFLGQGELRIVAGRKEPRSADTLTLAIEIHFKVCRNE